MKEDGRQSLRGAARREKAWMTASLQREIHAGVAVSRRQTGSASFGFIIFPLECLLL
jgi:hypothetical protein